MIIGAKYIGRIASKRQKVFIAVCLGFFAVIVGHAQDNFMGDDIRIFREVSWELAKAVESQDTIAIETILKSGNVDVNAREKKFGKTFLIWAVAEDRFYSARKLLQLGADPNLHDTSTGLSAVVAASAKKETSDYLLMVLKYGGDPNNEVNRRETVENPTPLIAASRALLENVKILVKAGANVHHRNKKMQSPLKAAVLASKVDIAHFLIFDCHVDVTLPMSRDIDGDPIYITPFLRYWIFPLDSPEYALKLEIIEFLRKKGLDYAKTEIPKELAELYPKEYLDKY